MFRHKVKEIAEQKGVSQSDLARLSGVSEPIVERLFLNSQEDLELATLARIAQALNVDISRLVESTGEAPPPSS